MQQQQQQQFRGLDTVHRPFHSPVFYFLYQNTLLLYLQFSYGDIEYSNKCDI